LLKAKTRQQIILKGFWYFDLKQHVSRRMCCTEDLMSKFKIMDDNHIEQALDMVCKTNLEKIIATFRPAGCP